AAATASTMESGAAPFLWCSDCRAPMRDRYFALNDRPVCAKCRPSYAERIARAEGPGAVWRVSLHGALIALVGAVVLAGAIAIFSPLRLFVVVPIGFLIGKRMMTALGGYSNRRYQYIAVSLTYLCFLVGFAAPSGLERREAAARRSATRAKMQGTLATEADALREELARLTPAQRDSVTSVDGGTESAPFRPPSPPVQQPIGPGPGLAVVMLLLLPFIASLQFGLMFSGLGFASIGYALYLAWSKTDGQGMHLKLTGPFRVGHGPIRAR
ncbi:MAG TPA: hypothetical protein VM076_20425, partial [Gemmatimonadaceae bacterium]|nr:hypothetical protein [Gemmatimonadaceae bacterium]